MAMFASIRDIKPKKVWQLKRLRNRGINGLSIGTETGDDYTLRLANKGYTAKDIIDQRQSFQQSSSAFYFCGLSDPV